MNEQRTHFCVPYGENRAGTFTYPAPTQDNQRRKDDKIKRLTGRAYRGCKVRRGHLAAHLGIFQAGTTALGWVLGATIIQYVAGWDHWLDFLLLGYVASKSGRLKIPIPAASGRGITGFCPMGRLPKARNPCWPFGQLRPKGRGILFRNKLIESSFDLSCEAFDENPSKGKTLVMLLVATSIDAFAGGLSITFMGVPTCSQSWRSAWFRRRWASLDFLRVTD